MVCDKQFPLQTQTNNAKGILYLASPISLFVLQRWPRVTRINSILGLAIAVTGVLTSSFATKMWQLTITQGVIYPIGGAMLYYPVLLFVDEWFERKKGLAFGVAWVSSSHLQDIKHETNESNAGWKRCCRRGISTSSPLGLVPLFFQGHHVGLVHWHGRLGVPSFGICEAANSSHCRHSKGPAPELFLPSVAVMDHFPNR